ncbi:hypothetical protein TWF718_008506 [Orbilia javanica]|uniref:Uncharacterized protein n=1 Tax=Orbilia javanica TaxID=47235 RepID=A0AAN8NUC6_9PEZI
MFAPNSMLVALLLASPFTNALYLKAPVNATSSAASTTSVASTTSEAPLVERRGPLAAPGDEFEGVDPANAAFAGARIQNVTKREEVIPITTPAASNGTATFSTLTVLTTTAPAATGDPKANQRADGGHGVLLRVVDVALRAVGAESSTSTVDLPSPVPFLSTSISLPASTSSGFPQLIIRQVNNTEVEGALHLEVPALNATVASGRAAAPALGRRGARKTRELSNSTIIARGEEKATIPLNTTIIDRRDLKNSTIIARGDLTNSTIVARGNSTGRY